MMEQHKKKEWRCPYCDALNDWQDRVCQICGEGSRDIQEQSEEEKPQPSQTMEKAAQEYSGPQPDNRRQEHSEPQPDNSRQEHAPKAEKVDVKSPGEEVHETGKTDTNQKRWSLSPAGCVLSAVAVAAMIYIYMIGEVAEDTPSQAAWFGLMAAICLINVGALFVKKSVGAVICLILKYLTDAIGVFMIMCAAIYFDPNIRDILVADDGIMFLLVLGIPALNCWMTLGLGKKKLS